MEIIVIILVLGFWYASLVWVHRDSTARTLADEPFLNFSPGIWVLFCALFWFPVFPFYLLGRLLDGPPKEVKVAPPPPLLPFPCPTCGALVQPKASNCACGQAITEEERAAGMLASQPKSRIRGNFTPRTR